MLEQAVDRNNACALKSLTENKWIERPLFHCYSKYESERSVVCE
jgi:hypothetical protein